MRVIAGFTFASIVLALSLARAAAQEPPKAPPAVVTTAPIAPADAKALQDARTDIVGLMKVQALLQKEVDSAVAEFQRTAARVNAAAPAGMELAPDLSVYVKKPEPKKDEPKKDEPAPHASCSDGARG